MKRFAYPHLAQLGLAPLLMVASMLMAGEQQPASAPRTKMPTIEVTDSRGLVLPSAIPGPNSQTVDVTVGPAGGDFTFSPSAVNVLVGDTVRWTWVGNNHTVTSGNSCTVDNKFCSPIDTNCSNAVVSNAGAVYTHTFAQAGTFPYNCRVHCNFGMRGTVNVVAPFVTITSVTRALNGHIIVAGKSLPSVTVTIKSAPDLLTTFGNPQSTSTDPAGVFQYDDASVVGASMQFYQATLP